MSAFAEKDFDAKGYASNRPSYPEQFYGIIDEYHIGPRNRLIDVGCGPGVATYQLADHLKTFKEILGTDISSAMVDKAKALKEETSEKYKKVSFEVSSADDFSFLKAPNYSCDMITAVQCIHWFNFDHFQRSAANVLRKEGTLAIWGYADPIFPKYPQLDSLLNNFTYGSENLGPFWESGRQLLRNLLRDFRLERELFTDFKEGCFDVDYIRLNRNDPLLIEKTLTLAEFQNYLRTWSSFHSWRKRYPQERDITENFIDNVQRLYPQLTKQSKLQVVWKSFYKLCRKL